ncbi:hypothetical protein MPL3356_330032 [Mesorhizobium plurifarium]|uniref:Uncharacterized protein n=1 Tax=Mesorhizobium plurifarium TaxID=69974 RepID=A0A090GDS8_MESPL|nr:hypothetical protein MPL3356_330032 [Mesorhizobium plurifarium]CDX43213.1 hypothetical protein MPLDJ20_60150 [Mesorhizobium plurifarium]CDX63347.1 hypothetical protein MPL3365_90028 [Mesorhizobium plurifarium]
MEVPIKANLQRGTLEGANGRRTRPGDVTIYVLIMPKKQASILQHTHAKRRRLWSNLFLEPIGPGKSPVSARFRP